MASQSSCSHGRKIGPGLAKPWHKTRSRPKAKLLTHDDYGVHVDGQAMVAPVERSPSSTPCEARRRTYDVPSGPHVREKGIKRSPKITGSNCRQLQTCHATEFITWFVLTARLRLRWTNWHSKQTDESCGAIQARGNYEWFYQSRQTSTSTSTPPRPLQRQRGLGSIMRLPMFQPYNLNSDRRACVAALILQLESGRELVHA